jgi:TolB-like protein/DNA-binding winged helix-turn-helix (wHTH) protein/tetratricopeptide (TPR) repeat protein
LATNAQTRTVLRFDNFEVHIHSGEVRKNGKTVRLQEQPFQVLRALLERPGEIVTREELKQQLWPEDTFVDFDDGLNTAVKKLRDTLGDSAESPRYIETVPRRGYRFIRELREPETSLAGSLESAQKEHSGTQEIVRHRNRPVRLILGLISLAAVILGILVLRNSRSTAPAKIQSMAVLPFANLSGDPSQEYFADAMTDEMTSDLAKIGALRVISRTSAMHYKGTSPTVPQIARELNVDGVIERSVLRTGDRVRITVQLIEARSDRHLWSESYERDLKDVLTLQSELARTIAGEVRAVITPAEEERLHPGLVDPAAYEAYMRGRFFVNRWTAEDSAQALHYFQLAAELDKNYALAYVGMAECYVYGVAGVTEKYGLERGFAAASRALELKPDMGEAHAILGFLRAERDWDFTGAEAEMKKGITLSPNYAPAHHWYSHLLIDLGRYDEAMVETRRLMELDPVSATPGGHLAYQYLASRQWDPAIAQYQKVLAQYQNALATDPSQIDEYCELGEAYLGKHMYPEAIAEMSRSVELSRAGSQYPFYLARLGNARAQAGDTAGARKILSELPPDDPSDAAYVYAGLGERDKSIALLKEAYHRHTFPLDSGHRVELDSLRSDSRFKQLLRLVHLR